MKERENSVNKIMSVLAAAIFVFTTSLLSFSHFSGPSNPVGVPSAVANKTIALNNGVASNQIVSAQIKGIDSVGLTVHDMEAELKFFTEVLPFKKVSDDEVVGQDFEELFGVFGCRARVVRLQLGKEFITLTQFLAPRGRPIPVDSNSNDGWFQHMAIVVSDMDGRLRPFTQTQH